MKDASMNHRPYRDLQLSWDYKPIKALFPHGFTTLYYSHTPNATLNDTTSDWIPVTLMNIFKHITLM